MKRYWSFIALLFLSLTIFPVQAQSSNVQLVFENIDNDATPRVQDADFPNISFQLTPIDQSGVPIAGLTEADFTLREDDSPVEEFSINGFQDDNQPISVMLLLDISGSIGRSGSLPALRDSAIRLVEFLQASDQAAILAFNITPGEVAIDRNAMDETTEIDFTNDGGALQNLINQLQTDPDGGTPLYDALFKGIELTTQQNFGRRVVILMTDGTDQGPTGRTDEPGSVLNADDPIDLARDNQIPVYTIGLGSEVDGGYLDRVATLTGGQYQQVSSATELDELFTDIAASFKQKYDFTFESQLPSDDAQHNLSVQVSANSGETGEETVPFQSLFPAIPRVRDIWVTLPRQEPNARNLDSLETVTGLVTLEPDIAARNAIAEVTYTVNDGEPVSVTEAPWAYAWNTRDLGVTEPEEVTLNIRITDANGNEGTEVVNVMVEPCNIICIINIRSPIPINGLIAILVLLLLLLVVYLMQRSRNNRVANNAPQPQPAFQNPGGFPPTVGASGAFPGSGGIPTVGADFDDAFTPPSAVGVTREFSGGNNPPRTVQIDGTPAPGGGRPRQPLKTEVLNIEPEHIAFLFDTDTKKQERLLNETLVGRAAECDIIYDESSVSTRHAKIRYEDKKFVLYDLAATNKTKVNGKTVSKRTLKDSDKILFGRKEATFRQVS